jgi:hypothetical protein
LSVEIRAIRLGVPWEVLSNEFAHMVLAPRCLSGGTRSFYNDDHLASCLPSGAAKEPQSEDQSPSEGTISDDHVGHRAEIGSVTRYARELIHLLA